TDGSAYFARQVDGTTIVRNRTGSLVQALPAGLVSKAVTLSGRGNHVWFVDPASGELAIFKLGVEPPVIDRYHRSGTVKEIESWVGSPDGTSAAPRFPLVHLADEPTPPSFDDPRSVLNSFGMPFGADAQGNWAKGTVGGTVIEHRIDDTSGHELGCGM